MTAQEKGQTSCKKIYADEMVKKLMLRVALFGH